MKIDDITIGNFREIFHEMNRSRERAGLKPVQDNPQDLLERASHYGLAYNNGSYDWGSNIRSRSAANSSVVNSEEELTDEHRELMRSCLEYMHTRPMIKIDANLGQQGSRAEMRCRLWCDSQSPDIAYRWQQLSFPGNPDAEPDAELFMIPDYLQNPKMPDNKDEMLMVIRFPDAGYTIVTSSSYQGEVKKGFLSHWINFVYRRGGTGEHSSLKEYTVKRIDKKLKRIVMSDWGLTGSGKSTHGLYIFTPEISEMYKRKFGINPLDFVSDQVLKNDDMVGLFEDGVFGSERGAWTKTEDVDEHQIGIFMAASSPRALHENTEYDEKGNPSFRGEVFTYKGRPNRNARSVLFFEDTGYFDGSVNSTEPLNMAVFISPGYLCDYAWLKINDLDFAAKVLADGRTVGHPAQSQKGIGEQKFSSRYCLPFTMGATNAQHVHRFREFLEKYGTENSAYLLVNTTGRVGAQYEWTNGGRPKPIFVEENGRRRVVGGTGPSIEETELFLLGEARGAVEYEPHPVWGEKALVPVKVDGLSSQRLRELNPFTYRDRGEMERLLISQIEISKESLSIQCPRLDDRIYHAMDF